MPKKKRRKQSPRTISTDHIETQRLSLVDEFGTKRAELFCSGGDGGTNGFTAFRLNGDDGSERVNIQVDRMGASIQLYCDGHTVVKFASHEDGAGMSIGDGDGRTCIIAEIERPQVKPHPGPEPPYLLIISPGKSLTITANGVETCAAPESALPCIPPDRSAKEATKKREECGQSE